MEISEKANDFVSYRLKPQMRTLGPRYGKLLGKIGAHLKEMDGAAVVEAFEKGENVTFELDGTTVDLAQSDVLVETEQKPGLMAQSEGGVTVVLDTNLTDDLILEGYARELISKVQTLRKESGLELTDRIRLTVSGSGKVAQALNACSDMIRKAVLAADLSASETPDEAGKETDLNGEKVTIRLEKE